MERYLSIKDSHTRNISAMCFNAAKREIVVGYEDGTLKGFDMESGTLAMTQNGTHNGMINFLLYWTESRLMLSGGNDGVIAAWLPSGSCFGKIRLYKAVYCMAINTRKHQMLVGLAGSMRIYELEEGDDNKFVKQPAIWELYDHADIVKCISCYEGRVYTASYDGYICVYESTIVTSTKVKPGQHTGLSSSTTIGSRRAVTAAAYRNRRLKSGRSSVSPTRAGYALVAPLERIDRKQAHDAGIVAMSVLRDNEGNVWIFTGSFDKSMKVWNRDCKLIHQMVGFVGPVCGVTYVPKTRSLWAAAGSSQVAIFEPKSGDNISEYISAAARAGEDGNEDVEPNFAPLHLLISSTEFGCVYASTYDKGIIGWKYQPDGCLTCIRSRYPLEAITYTAKAPILIFTGDQHGTLTKWERMEINQYLYMKEEVKVAEREKKDKIKRRPAAEVAGNAPPGVMVDGAASKTPNPAESTENRRHHKLSQAEKLAAKRVGVTELLYVEELDYIISASEDTFIYVWGFDPDACRALADLQRQAARRDGQDVEKANFQRFLDFLNVSEKESKAVESADAVVNTEAAGVTNRVAGYSCLSILSEHVDCVTSLCVISRTEGFGSTYLISGGWDRTICVWNLEQFMLNYSDSIAHVENEFQTSGGVQSDGVVTSLAYSPKTRQFAYASSDGNAYIHTFQPKARQMSLDLALTGHTAEVTTVRWNKTNGKWVTSSEDGTIRIWETTGECVQTLWNRDPVTTMCIDQTNGCIVAAVDRAIRVFEIEEYKLVQTNTGHSDQIRNIIHLPEPRNQYVSCGWDRTLRIWNAVRLVSHRPPPVTAETTTLTDGENSQQEGAGNEENDNETAEKNDDAS